MIDPLISLRTTVVKICRYFMRITFCIGLDASILVRYDPRHVYRRARWIKEDMITTFKVAPDGTLDEPLRPDTAIARNALKAWRGDRSQTKIARAAGIGQSTLSDLERGRQRLTPAIARKLAPALGARPDQLVLGEYLATLHRAAAKGKADPQPLLAEAERLTEVLPSGEIGDAILDALVEIVKVVISPCDLEEAVDMATERSGAPSAGALRPESIPPARRVFAEQRGGRAEPVHEPR
jgi:transcriptional regulator with XRE-family HTH domain